MEEIKRKRGRPRKNPLTIEPVVKRPRGRPRKNPLPIKVAKVVVKRTVKPTKIDVEPKKRGRPRKNPLIIDTVIKRPVGRPRKNPLPIIDSINDAPKKRGRPRKNPLTLTIEPIVKRPRGRPRKDAIPVPVAIPVKTEEPEKTKFFQSPQAVFAKHDQVLNTPSLNFKTGKLLGYCPTCNMFIMDTEQHGTRFECTKCGTLEEVSKLNKESAIKSDHKPRTKKEYLENCITLNEDHIESYVAKSPDAEIEKIIDPKIMEKEIEKDDSDSLPSDNKE